MKHRPEHTAYATQDDWFTRKLFQLYLKFSTSLEFPALATAICPGLTEDAIDWDAENVYEWMYLDLPGLDYSLNVSREHGCADVDDDLLDLHGDNDAELRKLVKPGSVYVFGWDRANSVYVDELPDSLARTLAHRLAVDVYLYSRRINVDLPDGAPIAVVTAESAR